MQGLGFNIGPEFFIDLYFDNLTIFINWFGNTDNIFKIFLMCFTCLHERDVFRNFDTYNTIKGKVGPCIKSIALTEQKPSLIILLQKVRVNYENLWSFLMEGLIANPQHASSFYNF